ncbi:MAG: ribonuclease HIII [Armatimonadetes bacterium]|nr:MAG: ribonuclease HIII [Armatimonadota bacterium]
MSDACIGIDESGKGDYFGPLVTAACYVGPEHWAELEEVRESKKIGDRECFRLDRIIRHTCPHAVVLLKPKKYNELYGKIRNLNRLLAWTHARAIESLLEQHGNELPEAGSIVAISDQFAKSTTVEDQLGTLGKKLRFLSQVRAEKELCVAAASVLARAKFLYQLKDLSEEWGVELPKGAGPGVVAAAKRFVAKHGESKLENVAKLHFRTTESVVSLS